MVTFTVLPDSRHHFKLNNRGPWTATKLLSSIKSWILEHFSAFMTLTAPLLINTTVVFKFWSSWLSSCTITSICIADLQASPAFAELILITHAFLKSHSGPFYICASHPVFLLVTELFYFVLVLSTTGKALWLEKTCARWKEIKKLLNISVLQSISNDMNTYIILMFCSSD